MSNYYCKLLTQYIPTNISNNISRKFIIKLLQKFYDNYSFSTLPYIFNQYNSAQSISNLNSGNCVALCIQFKNILKQYNIQSYLIPATIPNMYKKNKYLDISHVAIAIPLQQNTFFIVDLAFYFYEPILYSSTDLFMQFITLANIYQNKDDIIQVKNSILTKDLIYNKYQTIPKNIKYSICNYINNIEDSWKYFIIEILNPDKAISTFYINNSKPFLTITKFENKSCRMYLYLKFHNNILYIRINNEEYFNGTLSQLSNDQIIYLNKILKKNIKSNIIDYLKIPYKKISFIID
jgi:hypothetical protein